MKTTPHYAVVFLRESVIAYVLATAVEAHFAAHHERATACWARARQAEDRQFSRTTAKGLQLSSRDVLDGINHTLNFDVLRISSAAFQFGLTLCLIGVCADQLTLDATAGRRWVMTAAGADVTGSAWELWPIVSATATLMKRLQICLVMGQTRSLHRDTENIFIPTKYGRHDQPW
jgi:hypothetical protein